MGLLRLNLLRLDTLHYALLVAIVLLAVYAFGSFREGIDCSQWEKKTKCEQHKLCKWFTNTNQVIPGSVGFFAPPGCLPSSYSSQYLGSWGGNDARNWGGWT